MLLHTMTAMPANSGACSSRSPVFFQSARTVSRYLSARMFPWYQSIQPFRFGSGEVSDMATL